MQPAEQNQIKGEAFLAENAKRDEVIVLDSGLQFRVIEPGDGAQPTVRDRVTVHYRGTLVNGTEFDSSHGDSPVTFPLAQVIPGWIEALQLMKVGDKWELFIPSDLAYGPQGAEPDIGPNETLIFEVELLGIG
jgi:FKBP-type peptidyl-prolyl cis-trans isomerase FklB